MKSKTILYIILIYIVSCALSGTYFLNHAKGSFNIAFYTKSSNVIYEKDLQGNRG